MKKSNRGSRQVGVVGEVLAALVHGREDGVEVVVLLAGARAQRARRLAAEPKGER